MQAAALLAAVLLCAAAADAARTLHQADPAAYPGASPAFQATQAQARTPVTHHQWLTWTRTYACRSFATLTHTQGLYTEHWSRQVLSLAQRRERAAALQQRLSVADASNATGGGAAPASSGAASGADAAAAPAPGEWLTALKPTGTQRRTLAEVNAGSPTYTGALRAALRNGCWCAALNKSCKQGDQQKLSLKKPSVPAHVSRTSPARRLCRPHSATQALTASSCAGVSILEFMSLWYMQRCMHACRPAQQRQLRPGQRPCTPARRPGLQPYFSHQARCAARVCAGRRHRHTHQPRRPGAVALSRLCSCADPASGVSVRPVAASTGASAVPSPAIAGGANVAAANADTLAASQARASPAL